MKRALVILGALVACIVGGWAQDDDGWIGLSGKELMEAVGRGAYPTGYYGNILGSDGFWDLMMQADGEDGGLTNHFGAGVLSGASGVGYAPEGVYIVNVISPEWWEISQPYGEGLQKDLYNIFPAEEWVGREKGALPPGVVDGVGSSDVVRIGTGRMGNGEIRLWEPPEQYKGDVARVVMYMLAVYHRGIIPFGGPGYGFIGGAEYPVMSGSASRLMMAWHRADPVSDIELRRNEVFIRVQGHVNPFVAYPELAEYLWGEKAGEPYKREPAHDDDPEVDHTPLRGVYRITDERINLIVSGVPDDVVWSLDGVAVQGDHLVPAEVGIGRHILQFKGVELSGKVMIEIVR